MTKKVAVILTTLIAFASVAVLLVAMGANQRALARPLGQSGGHLVECYVSSIGPHHVQVFTRESSIPPFDHPISGHTLAECDNCSFVSATVGYYDTDFDFGCRISAPMSHQIRLRSSCTDGDGFCTLRGGNDGTSYYREGYASKSDWESGGYSWEHAFWGEWPMEVGISVSGNGSISRTPYSKSGFYLSGTEVALTAYPDSYWTFSGWSGDTDTTDNPLVVIADQEWDIVATFETTATLTPTPSPTPSPTPTQTPTPSPTPTSIPTPTGDAPEVYAVDFGDSQIVIESPDTSNFPRLSLPALPVIELPSTLDLPAVPELSMPALPSSLNLPSMPELNAPSFPSTLNLPSLPELPSPEPIVFYTLPSHIDLEPMTYPKSLNLPEPPTLTSSIPETFTVPGENDLPTVPITQASSGLLASMNPVISQAKQLNNNVQSYLGDVESMNLGGYTAEEVANEMVLGMDTAFSYARAIRSIGIIGPTALAITIGISWIFFISSIKLAMKALLLVVDVIVRIVEIVATFLGMLS